MLRRVWAALSLTFVLAACGFADPSAGGGDDGAEAALEALATGDGYVKATVDGSVDEFTNQRCRDLNGIINMQNLAGDGYTLLVYATGVDRPVTVQILRDGNLYGGDELDISGGSLKATTTLTNVNDSDDSITVDLEVEC